MNKTLKLSLIMTAFTYGLSACSVVNTFAPEKQTSDLVFVANEVGGDEMAVDFCAIPEPEVEAPIIVPEPKKPNLAAKLYFITDTTILIAESAAEAEDLYQKVLDMNASEVVVIGHTDTMASREYNIDLSLRRAEYVKNELIARGVDPSIIEASWHGEGLLLIATPDETEEQKNRRVEIYVR
jgi:outer membrane protein OmpA-like peptidoglycan-associated protein